MPKYKIFAVGFDLPGDDFEFVSFQSNQTLLDADIILYEPSLGRYSTVESYNGRPLLTENSSFKTKEQIDHWRSEISEAAHAGKLVIVYLKEPTECYRYTGDKSHSGTGRSRVTTNHVESISSYDAVPFVANATAKSGTNIRLESQAPYLSSYWSEFGGHSPYEVEIAGRFSQILLKSRSGNRIIGAEVRVKSGILLFLPPLDLDEDSFITYDDDDEQVWTDQAIVFGKRLTATLVALANNFSQSTQKTPAPAWTEDSKFRLSAETRLEAKISQIGDQISDLQVKRSEATAELSEAGRLRDLLYEQGKPLENALLEALRLIGFEAQPFSDGESEFDAVFVCPEVRCLGEAEGKDNKAINIDKLSQLERNIQEDFGRDEVAEFAKGVLFGNAYRLSPLDDRGDYFTDKCVSGARRSHVALVRTPDLFLPAKYLNEHGPDIEYARECREAIINCEGDVVVFPNPPIMETIAGVAES